MYVRPRSLQVLCIGSGRTTCTTVTVVEQFPTRTWKVISLALLEGLRGFFFVFVQFDSACSLFFLIINLSLTQKWYDTTATRKKWFCGNTIVRSELDVFKSTNKPKYTLSF